MKEHRPRRHAARSTVRPGPVGLAAAAVLGTALAIPAFGGPAGPVARLGHDANVAGGTVRLEAGRYLVRNACSGKLVDVHDANPQPWSRVELRSEGARPNPGWDVTPLAGGWYRFGVPGASSVLQSSYSRTASGSVLDVWSWWGGSAQTWRAWDVGGGAVSLELAGAPAVRLDVKGAGTRDGTDVQVWKTNSTCAQRFTLSRVGGRAPSPSPSPSVAPSPSGPAPSPTTPAPTTPAPTTPTTPTAPTAPAPSGPGYYVAGNGDDSDPGTSDRPFRTLQKAADRTQPGDTVWIKDGTYTDPAAGSSVLSISRSGTPDRWITYRAYPGASPVIKMAANWGGITVSRAAYITVEGLDVRGYADTIAASEALAKETDLNDPRTNHNCIQIAEGGGHSHHVVIRDNRVSNCSGGGIGANRADYVTIEGNTVADTSKWSPYATSAISTYQNWDSDGSTAVKIIIRGNVISGIENRVRFFYSGNDPASRTLTDGNDIIIDDSRNTQKYAGGSSGPYRGATLIENNLALNSGGRGVHVYSSDNVTVRNNTLRGNARTPGICCELDAYDASNVLFANNVVYARGDRPATGTGNAGNVRFEHNLYYGAASYPNRSGSDQVADPQFVRAGDDPATSDYRLGAGSPAQDKGTSECPGTDITGAARSRPCTLGAYE